MPGPRPNASARNQRTVRRFLPAFRRDTRGVTAIEFGIIAAPLFGLIFAVMQSSLAFFMQQGLRAALDAAARQVLTGEANSNTAIVDGPSFRDQLICNKGILPGFMSCPDIVVDIRPSTTSNFSGLQKSNVDSSFMPNGAQYNAGQPCQIMIVRAVYPMASFLPLITWGTKYSLIQNTTGLTTYKGKLVNMLTAASVFRNEPFVASDGTTGACP